MVEVTILTAFANWAISGVASGIVANITYDGLKKLKSRITNNLKDQFENDTEISGFFDEINSKQIINKNKPFRDIEDAYENVTNRSIPENFIGVFKDWIKENEDLLKSIGTANNGFIIEKQEAGRDILNIQGNPIINNYGDRNE
ncbi:hypothetical protein ABE61_05290 [Lysinibacillus sphaericus]|uniref:hypothetical protein n=1 Tax=Lysinibacillus sphaericus TaxID=1421 RepID=UPI0018CEAA60|nr:hypothetical protein [Lysinibacillus sphaericus]MBG9453508.1 hypothetical protein [Lysinibacillus sphaericus]MBG9480349.1 hypothetical protein [Lysinibacillus sphaericus]MBG9595028.1 hypothetical protein [Lysinibacillus sphaericus]